MCFHNKFTSSKLFYNTESFLCCFKNFVGKVVTMNTQAQSEARSEFLQHDLLYALDFLTHCSLQVQQVPSVMLNHLYLKVTPNENHTGLNQVRCAGLWPCNVTSPRKHWPQNVHWYPSSMGCVAVLLQQNVLKNFHFCSPMSIDAIPTALSFSLNSLHRN